MNLAGGPNIARSRFRPAVALAVAVISVAAGAAMPMPRAIGAMSIQRFRPQPASRPMYGIGDATEKINVVSTVGTEETNIFTETWLPVALAEGPTPPTKLPTVLVMSPYSMEGKLWASYEEAKQQLVPRGYAFSVMHTRGTGTSGGCATLLASDEAADGAATIEHLATKTSWGNGVVGTFGGSYAGATQINTATRGDRTRTQYLKAMVVGAPNASWYDYLNHDGVRGMGGGPVITPAYTVNSFLPYGSGFGAWDDPREVEYALDARTSPGGTPVEQAPEKVDCQPAHYVGTNDPSGDVTPWYAERESRAGLSTITAATLLYHGHADINVLPIVQAGLFDRIRAPKAGLFGEWAHRVTLASVPDTPTTYIEPEPHSSIEIRSDYWDMVFAWYDRYLKGIDTGTDAWPVAQVQDNTGRWRAEPDWPATGGPAGQLVLGAGTIGPEPTGAGVSTYIESPLPVDRASGLKPEGSFVTFTSPPLDDRLQITGQPVLDLYLQVEGSDAHVGVELRTFDATGSEIGGADDAGHAHTGGTAGFRSMQHLDPFVDGRFVQSASKPVPDGIIHTIVRLRPVDLVVPKGGKVELTISGVQRFGPFAQPTEEPSWPSFANARVTVLHDCAHPSALRFVMPTRSAPRLDVRAPAAAATQPSLADLPVRSDGGGVATAKRCGRAPIRIDDLFGPLPR